MTRSGRASTGESRLAKPTRPELTTIEITAVAMIALYSPASMTAKASPWRARTKESSPIWHR
ncbi:hypothetical protein HRbin26_00815 [bacterium HR26]|nr:hypothetical protein HRbin26_00815 [bacterium HR26]